MDYDKTKVALWSRCSVEEITKNYNNIIAAQGKFCMTIGLALLKILLLILNVGKPALHAMP
jgi:hypothetical protein